MGALPSLLPKVLSVSQTHLVARYRQLFTGRQNATLTLQVAWEDNDVRRTGEAQLQVAATIQHDVVVKPEFVSFVDVRQGAPHEQKFQVSSDGSKNWHLKEIQCGCENLEVDFCEACRSSDRIAYDMFIRLADYTPAG